MMDTLGFWQGPSPGRLLVTIRIIIHSINHLDLTGNCYPLHHDPSFCHYYGQPGYQETENLVSNIRLARVLLLDTRKWCLENGESDTPAKDAGGLSWCCHRCFGKKGYSFHQIWCSSGYQILNKNMVFSSCWFQELLKAGELFLKNVTYISACISTNLSQLPRSICAHIAVGGLRSSQAAALPWARPSASWQKITAILLMEEIPTTTWDLKPVPWYHGLNYELF